MRQDPLLPRPLGRPDLLSLSTVRARYPRDRDRSGRGPIAWVLIVAFVAAVIGATVGEWLRP